MEFRSGRILGKTLSVPNMEGEMLSMPLPEELVERIVAMIPFPQIFKARVLSKSWRARFSSISAQDDEEKKLVAMSFQKRVCEWSYRWKTYSPVFLFHDFLIAYDDHASQHCRKIPTLHALSNREVLKVAELLSSGAAIASLVGALLLVRSPRDQIMFMVNIFTGNWKQLPAVLRMNWRSVTSERLVTSRDMYKVIRLYTAVGCVGACIYDSKLCAWRTKSLEVLENFVVGQFDVHLNGILTVLIGAAGLDWGFLTFDVEEESFNLIQLPSTTDSSEESILRSLLLACNGTLFSVVPVGLRIVYLQEFNLVTRTSLHDVQFPPAPTEFGDSYRVISNGDCMFFKAKRQNISDGKVVVYNVQKHEWSSLDMKSTLSQCLRSYRHYTFDGSFEPGMNTFLEV